MLNQEVKSRCEGLAREFLKRIEPWAGKMNAKVLWTERKPFNFGGRVHTPRAVPVREGVTLSAPWCEQYGYEFRARERVEEDTPLRPHGSGIDAMRARDQWRHDTHVLRMPDMPSPWEPLLEMWKLGAMIDKLYDDESKEGPKCLLIEYSQ